MSAIHPRRRALAATAAVLVAAIAMLLAAPAARAQSLEEILKKNYEARGGLDKLKAIKSMRITGKMTMGMGIEAPTTLEFKRPSRVRIDFSFQGMSGTQAFDGKNGWMVMPFMGKNDPEAMAADDLKMIEEQADMDGPLVDWKAKGHTVELVGKDQVEGADAYKLKVTLKNGDVRTMWLDADSYLEIKQESKVTRMGGEIDAETSLGDYKAVEGVMMPFSIESGAKGSPQKQSITIEKIEVNVPIDDARFTMPAPKPADDGAKPDAAPAKPDQDSKKG